MDSKSANIRHFQKHCITFVLYAMFVIFLSGNANAQEIDTLIESNESINQRIENLAEETEDENADYTELIDQLEFYKRNPLNLNSATAQELKQLMLLNDVQILNLINHRNRFGNIISIYELQAIDGFTVDAIRELAPYIKIEEYEGKRHFSLKEMFEYGEHQFFLRHQQVIEEQVGFSPIDDSTLLEEPNARYLGSKDKIYTRYRFKYYKNISWGFTAEKDPGEEFFRGSQKNGFDFYSAHFHLKDMGVLKALSLGDYSVQFGQGLTAWSALAFGKSSEAINIKRNPQGIVSFRSVDENLFLRGGAATLNLKNFDVSGFYSKKKIDANIAEFDSLTKDIAYVSSLQVTGFHRTPSELEDKHAIDEEIIGSNISFKKNNLNLGVTALQTKYGSELLKDPSDYNQFEFSGKQNTNIGFDYGLLIRNINFFGEIGQSSNGGLAYLNGMLVSLHHHLAVSILHRHYDSDFHGLKCNGFSENTRNINEDGIYTGLEYKPSKYWKLTAYADHFKFPWLKFRTNAPSIGFDYFIQANYRPSKKMEMYLRYKQEDKEINSINSEEIPIIENKSKKNARFNIRYKLSEILNFKNRVEWVGYSEESKSEDNGYLMYQDISLKPKRKPYSFYARYAIFDTDSYDSRIYAFENDVLYAYSIPAYYNKGSRYYFLLNYSLSKSIEFWIRYSQTTYKNIEYIGTGKDQINGNKKSELKVQLRFKI